jgi:hypothetical protein
VRNESVCAHHLIKPPPTSSFCSAAPDGGQPLISAQALHGTYRLSTLCVTDTADLELLGMPLATQPPTEAAVKTTQRSGSPEPATTAQDVALRKKKRLPSEWDAPLAGTHCLCAHGDCTDLTGLQREGN